MLPSSPRAAERGESFYNPLLQPLVDDLMERGVAELSDGAKCVFVEVSARVFGRGKRGFAL